MGMLHSLLGSVRPPEWMVDELQNRVVLFLNHVLMQEPQAQDRLRRPQAMMSGVISSLMRWISSSPMPFSRAQGVMASLSSAVSAPAAAGML